MADFCPGIFYKMRIPTPWIFDLIVFQKIPIWKPLGSAHILFTHCLLCPRSAIEGSPFDFSFFPMFLKGLRSGLRNLISASAWPSNKDLSQLTCKYLYCCWVALSIQPLLADYVLSVSSWSRGSLMIEGLLNFLLAFFAGKWCAGKSSLCLHFESSL